MGNNKSIDEQMFSMKWRTFIPMIFFIIVGTNTVSLTLQRLSNVEEQAEYDINANKRRISNAVKDLEYKRKIEGLEKELKNCKKK
jgi:hypothetical protein